MLNVWIFCACAAKQYMKGVTVRSAWGGGIWGNSNVVLILVRIGKGEKVSATFRIVTLWWEGVRTKTWYLGPSTDKMLSIRLLFRHGKCLRKSVCMAIGHTPPPRALLTVLNPLPAPRSWTSCCPGLEESGWVTMPMETEVLYGTWSILS